MEELLIKKLNLKNVLNKPKTQKLPKSLLEFIPFKEVWNNCVFLENGNIVGGIKIGSINLSLLFDEEQKLKVSQLKKVLNSIDYPIKIFSIDKPVDLSDNSNTLGSKIKSERNKYKEKLLKEDYEYINFLSKQNSVVNRDFYLILEENNNNEKLLKQKVNDLIQEFNSINLSAEIIMSEEWRELLYENDALHETAHGSDI